MKRPFTKTVLMLSGWAVACWLATRQGSPAPSTPSKTVVVTSSIGETPLGKTFREWSSKPELDGALVALCVLDEHGNVRFTSPLAETALCPASAMKTLTTGAAFGLLGPSFRFETTLDATAPITADGTIAGDLVLTASGDPTLTTTDLEALADEAVAKGLKRVDGGLRVDTGIFTAEPVSDHWNRGDTGNGYGAGAYGINVDHNRMSLAFDPGVAQGDPARFLGSDPSPAGIVWSTRVTTGPRDSGDGLMVYSEPLGNHVEVRGTVPLGENGFTTTAAIPDPPRLALDILRARLAKAGVTFTDRDQPAGSRAPLARHVSAELPEIVDHLHRVSDNLEAQCLFLTLGNLKKEDPADTVRKFWEAAGVSFHALRMEDGNGLARATMIRPLDLARVNYKARHATTGPRFYQSLPASADGTMHSKRGAMSGVRTEVGFLTLPDGGECTFALMANGLSPDPDFWKLRTELLESVRTSGH